MLNTIRFGAPGDYFKFGNIILRQPDPNAPDMDSFRQRFFEMTGEPYDMYEARMAAATPDKTHNGFWGKLFQWLSNLAGMVGPTAPIDLTQHKDPTHGPTKPDNDPPNQ